MSGEEKAPASEAAAPQCQFFVQRKKRLCRMTVKPGRHYCGEHDPHPKTEAGQTDKRIPCPNDPKHTVYASKLLKHLAICNARRTEQPPYIVENINAPEAVETCPRLPLNSYPKDMVANVIDKINHLYAKHVEGHITTEPPSPVHRAVLPEFIATDRAESSRRHLRQVSALLWCAERAPLCQPRTCYVELGAGKGQLSYYAAHAWCAGTGSRVLAVDRAPLRHKRDNKLRSAPPTLDTQHSDIDTQQNDANRTSETEKDASNDDQRQSNHNDHSGNRINETANNRTTDDQRENDNNHSDRNNDYTDVRINDNKHNPLNEHIVNGDTKRISNEIENKNDDNNTSNSKRNIVNKNKTVTDEVMNVDDEESRVSANGKNKEAQPAQSDKDIQNVNDSGEPGAARSVSNSESDVAVRLRADLAHLALEAVPVVAESAAVVGLAKHLCGVATDYALRCVAAPGVVNKTRGLVLATCCHHRVERAPYVANQQLQELGINPEEFNIMLGIVSWATCGDGRSRERRLEDRLKEQELTGMTDEDREVGSQRGRAQEREETGRRAKALLDWGRVLWLRARGLDARLRYYVTRDVSLENVAIVAVRR